MIFSELQSAQLKRKWLTVRAIYTFTRYWLILFILLFGIYNLLPFLAPVAMKFGWTSLGNTIYDVYSTQCHQMAQRSFFLFGTKPMYELNELPVSLTGQIGLDELALRAIRGNEVLGWKVAWSDRMVYMYGSLWLASIMYYVLRQPTRKPMRLWIFVFMLIPLTLDGITHLLSDLNGLTSGFRYDNGWLARLTNNVFANSFYIGDALGSFNATVRFFSGVLFGFAVAGLVLPLLDSEMHRTGQILVGKLEKRALRFSTATPQDS
ncbi:MAG: DUF2085 domain-containing protein [Chloroflexota bacterium]